MKKVFLGVLATLLVGAGALFAGSTVRNTTEVYNFINGFQVAGSTWFSGTASAPTWGGSGVTSLTIGGASLQSLTVTTDGTGTGEVVLPAGAVDAAEIGAAFMKVTFCGQNDENGTIYFAPTLLTSVEPALADATCDGNDNATEATADAPLSATTALYPKYMACVTNGTLGASETLTFQLRSAVADVTGVTCSMATGETTCEVATPTASPVAAGATVAMKVVEVSNNADDDSKCVVYFGLK